MDIKIDKPTGEALYMLLVAMNDWVNGGMKRQYHCEGDMDYNFYVNYGICMNIDANIIKCLISTGAMPRDTSRPSIYTSRVERTMDVYFKSWDRYSGKIAWPVPACDGKHQAMFERFIDNGFHMYEVDSGNTRYDDYCRLRRDLLTHCISCLKRDLEQIGG